MADARTIDRDDQERSGTIVSVSRRFGALVLTLVGRALLVSLLIPLATFMGAFLLDAW